MDFMDGMEQRLSDIRGITLKSLLENPSFLQPPTSNKAKGKANEEKDGKKNKEAGFLDGFGCGNDDVAAAFLGPALWEKTPYDELKLEYMDLDEFLSENGIAVAEGKEDDEGEMSDGEQSPHSGASSPAYEPSGPRVAIENMPSLAGAMGMSMLSPTPSPPPVSPSAQRPEIGMPPDMSPVRTPSPVHIEVPFDINETDVALATAPGQETFNPKSCTFTDEELKPQPMIKKSRKIYVPSEQKDEKYWERRRKNNIAAKRSRDARRIKENQIVIRAKYLMKENGALKGDILDLKKENSTLKKVIESYEKRLNGMNMD